MLRNPRIHLVGRALSGEQRERGQAEDRQDSQGEPRA